MMCRRASMSTLPDSFWPYATLCRSSIDPLWPMPFCRSSRRLARAHGAEFELLVIGRAENQALHIDAGEVDRVGVEAADGDDFLDLGDADLCRGRHRLDRKRVV